MSMSVEQMRAEVARLYDGPAWKAKVAAMSEAQIWAIYIKKIK